MVEFPAKTAMYALGHARFDGIGTREVEKPPKLQYKYSVCLKCLNTCLCFRNQNLQYSINSAVGTGTKQVLIGNRGDPSKILFVL